MHFSWDFVLFRQNISITSIQILHFPLQNINICMKGPPIFFETTSNLVKPIFPSKNKIWNDSECTDGLCIFNGHHMRHRVIP